MQYVRACRLLSRGSERGLCLRCYATHRGVRAAAISPPLCHTDELFAHDGRVMLLGIDPGGSGAIAVLQWDNSQARPDITRATLSNEGINVDVFDLPTHQVALGKSLRKRVDPKGVHDKLKDLLPSDGTLVRAFLEHNTPPAMNGKLAWYGSGFNQGLLTGLFIANDVPVQAVSAVRWKGQLGLFNTGKEGSLALARQVFPSAAGFLKRKKDDGRAEALLIAASGMGLRMAIRRGLDDSSGDTWINATTDDWMDPFVSEELSA